MTPLPQQRFDLEHRSPVSRSDLTTRLTKQRTAGLAFQDAALAVKVGGVAANVELLLRAKHRQQRRQALCCRPALCERDEEARVMSLGKD